MKKYILEITETRQKQISILASSTQDAITLISQQYERNEITFNEQDNEVSIEIISKDHLKQKESLKKQYPQGTRIRCLHMNDPYQPVPEGMTGTVKAVDDAGTIHVHWDNGSSLGLIPEIDVFEKTK